MLRLCHFRRIEEDYKREKVSNQFIEMQQHYRHQESVTKFDQNTQILSQKQKKLTERIYIKRKKVNNMELKNKENLRIV